MNVEAQIEQLEALLVRIQRNAEVLRAERASGPSASALSATALTSLGRGESEPPKASELSAPVARLESVLPPEPELLESDDLETVPPPLATESVAPEPVEMESLTPDAPESASPSAMSESLAPESLGAESLGVESVPPDTQMSVDESFRESVRAPTESELPSDIELELTDDLANNPVEEVSFEEQPPHSSEKPVEGLAPRLDFHAPGMDGLASSIGEAVERAATDDPRTPPPESGPQMTVPPAAGYEYEPEPELDEADVPLSSHAADVPTVSQLGTTVDLEPAPGLPEELELAVADTNVDEQTDEFEANLPGREFGGGYDASLAAPSNAREELEGYDRLQREREARTSTAPAERSQPPPAPEGSEGADEGYTRPPVDVTASPVVFEGERRQAEALSFMQRLDAALSLGR